MKITNRRKIGTAVLGPPAGARAQLAYLPQMPFIRYQQLIPKPTLGGTEAETLSTTPEDFERHLKINLLSLFSKVHEAARVLIENKQGGRIVFIGSWAAHALHPQILPYYATKAALRTSVQCVAIQLDPN